MFLKRAVILAGLIAAAPAVGEESKTYQNLLTPLLSSGETVIGQQIAYPAGTAKVTAAIVTIPPGGETGWHTHAVPLLATILEGELSIDYGSKGIKMVKAGDAMLEAENWPHNATNHGTVPVKILAVYMGVDGVLNAEVAAGPK
ncbi:MAG TPA: cupin domain-containing protein [Bauldia sp.]|nr:cupin domain-containing protein [Bauldia sp.]